MMYYINKNIEGNLKYRHLEKVYFQYFFAEEDIEIPNRSLLTNTNQ